jgi:hypothetical protein
MTRLQNCTRNGSLLALLTLTVGLIASVCIVPAYCTQRVVLRTGSTLICDHQQNLGDQVRLYFAVSGDSYLDVASNQILRTETVPASIATQQTAPSVLRTLPGNNSPAVSLPALLAGAGAEHHIDPDLLASVVRAESGGHARAVSRTGARGLMQLMPGTAADLGVGDSMAPEQNVAGGTTYLDALLMYYHDNLALALAAYNAGPAAVNRYGGIPPYAETRRYVARVIHDYNRRKLQEKYAEARRQTEISSVSSPAGTVAGQ